MPNEPLAEITDGEQLFRKIIEPYKGKVVYLDVWGHLVRSVQGHDAICRKCQEAI